MIVLFHYLYRDAHNYKNHNVIAFSNPNNLSLEEIDRCIRKHLIEGEWFYHKNWQLPDLHFEEFNPNTDHFLHEYNYIELSGDETLTPISTIEAFLSLIASHSNTFPGCLAR